MNFEIVLSRTEDATIDTIKTMLGWFEKMVYFAGIDVKGASKELFEDKDFNFHLKVCLCESSV